MEDGGGSCIRKATNWRDATREATGEIVIQQVSVPLAGVALSRGHAHHMASIVTDVAENAAWAHEAVLLAFAEISSTRHSRGRS